MADRKEALCKCFECKENDADAYVLVPTYQAWKKDNETIDKIAENANVAENNTNVFARNLTSNKGIKNITKSLSTKDINAPTFLKSKSTNALTDCDKRSHFVQPKSWGFSSEKRDSDALTRQDRTKTVPVCQFCLKKINEKHDKKINKK